ncbi:MAG: TetR/AcrR family transcriptional regulator [Pseudomonadota bacterium]
MEQREKNIVDAAVRVFHRYGVKRASMNDIAEEAGVARQTLYNVYSNKDDILRGAIRKYCEDAIAAIESELPYLNTLEAQIALVLRESTLKPYTILHSSPNAQDLIDGFNETGREELEKSSVAFRDQLIRILTPHADSLSSKGLEPVRLAEIVQRAAGAFKYQATDQAHLEAMLDGLVNLAVAASRT